MRMVGHKTGGFEDLECEPGTVNWQNFGDTDPSAMMRRFFYGFFTVYIPALAIWLSCRPGEPLIVKSYVPEVFKVGCGFPAEQEDLSSC